MTSRKNKADDGYDVVEARLDGELLAEARLPGDGVPAGTGDTPLDESILGATPAETPAVEPADESTETPQEKYQRLLGEGYKPSQIEVLTNLRGTAVEVRLI